MEKNNKLLHVFTFEDLYKDEEDELDQTHDTYALYELNSSNKKNDKANFKSSKTKNYNYKKKLTKNTKLELFLRIFLFSLTIMFIPLSIMATNGFDKIEKEIIFEKIKNLVTHDKLLKIPKIIHKIFLSKDFVLGISCTLYNIVHPYISLKILFASSTFYYIIILMKFINQPKRPLWEIMNNNNINDIIICETSFSSPCEEIFFISFYFLYPIFCIRSFYSNGQIMNIFAKIIIFIIYLLLIIIEHIYLLLYELNYFHEIIYTDMLTLIFICILIDFDSKFQKKFFDSTKNLFKTRKNKLKILLFCCFLFTIGAMLFNFILPSKLLYEVIDKLSNNESCTVEQKENFGMKSTFINISFIFSMLGGFWGACLTLEYNPGEWWYQPLIIEETEMDKIRNDYDDILENKINCCEIFLLIVKCIIIIIIYAALCFGFEQIPYITFEFSLMMNIIKYFSITFICFGIMPIMFGFLHMNKKVGDIYDNLNEINEEINDWSKNLFAASLFVNYQEKARYPYIHLKRNKFF